MRSSTSEAKRGFATIPALRIARGGAIRVRSVAGIRSDKTRLVTGEARAGTTWVGELVVRLTDAHLFFEPDHPRRGRLFRQMVEDGADSESRVAMYRRLARGAGANNWSTRELRGYLSTKPLVLKSIFATDLVPELVRANLFATPVIVVRHPCAVVASQMFAGFSAPSVERLISPERVARYPQLDGLRDLSSPHQRFALSWALSYLPVASTPDNRVFIALYENFVDTPVATIEKLASHLGVEAPQSLNTGRASITDWRGDLRLDRSQLSKWQDRLTAQESREILQVVYAAGIALYDQTPMPVGTELEVTL